MDSKIQALLDHEEIRNLRTLYAHHLDSNNIAELDQVFSPDAVVEVTVGKMEGIAAIQAGLKEAYTLFDRDNKSNYPFMHVIANHWIKLTGPDSAEGRCYLVDFETASKPDGLIQILCCFSDYITTSTYVSMVSGASHIHR